MSDLRNPSRSLGLGSCSPSAGIGCPLNRTNTFDPSAPTQVTGLVGWYKANALVLNDGDPIASWMDSSGAGHTATAAGSARPTYKNAAISGWPVARFDGVANALTVSITTPNMRSVSAFMVMKINSPSTTAIWVSDGNQFGFKNVGGVFQLYNAPASVLSVPNGFFDVGFVTGASTCTYYDKLSTDAQTPISDAGLTINMIGSYTAGVLPLAGDIAELLIYNKPVSSAEATTIQKYLFGKYVL